MLRQFDEDEWDVLLYVMTYLDVYGRPPLVSEVKRATGHSAVRGLIARDMLRSRDLRIHPNMKRMELALSEELHRESIST
jgi:hypothetical protein